MSFIITSLPAINKRILISATKMEDIPSFVGLTKPVTLDFLTGNEFRGQMEAIVEGFMSMKQSITKERIQMEKIWKEREKQLEKVLLSTSGMYGSVKGIAGASV